MTALSPGTLITLACLSALVSAAGVVALVWLATAEDRARPVGRARSHVRVLDDGGAE